MKTYRKNTPLAGLSRCLLTDDKQAMCALSYSRKQQFRAGMTLVELLVVTVLLSILVSTAIPVISPNNDSRKIREASRAINAYLAAAQAKAIETGRPYGVEFTRLSDTTGSGEDNGACIQLTQIEVPPYFTGIDGNSVARIRPNYLGGNLNWAAPYVLEFLRRDDTAGGALPGYSNDLFPPSLIRPNDVIEFMGTRFYVVDNNTDQNGYSVSSSAGNLKEIGLLPVQYHVDEDDRDRNYVTNWNPIDLVPNQSGMTEWNGVNRLAVNLIPYLDESNLSSLAYAGWFWTEPASYKIERQPTPTSGEPLQLPNGMAIDLTVSGIDLGSANESRFYDPSDYWDNADSEINQADVATSPRILFTPSGGISVQMSGEEPQPVTGSLSLCVGRVELVNFEISDQAVSRAGSIKNAYQEPIDLYEDVVEVRQAQSLDTREPASEIREITDKFNWLNMDSRWVVVSGRSGSIVTVPNTYVDPNNDPDTSNDNTFSLAEQLQVALENAPTRITAGGR